jgi:hypothetical protein
MTHQHEDNSHAGQGAVVLDIGDGIGALVVLMPAALAGVEIEARPLGVPAPGHLPHVAVLARPLPGGEPVHSAVFADLPAGTYELSERPSGPVRLTATVTGGAVADAVWP